MEYDVETGEEKATLYLDINSYAEEMIMLFITGDKPLSKFEDFQKQLDKMGLKRLLKIQQDAYDAYNKK